MESEENFLIFPASINKSQGERKRKGRPRKKGRGGTRQFARGRNTKLTRKTDKLIRAVNAQLFPAGKRNEAEREARSSPELKVEISTKLLPDRPMSEKESRSRRQRLADLALRELGRIRGDGAGGPGPDQFICRICQEGEEEYSDTPPLTYSPSHLSLHLRYVHDLKHAGIVNYLSQEVKSE